MPRTSQHAGGFPITVLLLALPLAYVLSFGPACWLESRCSSGVCSQVVHAAYEPLFWSADALGDRAWDILTPLAEMGMRDGAVFLIWNKEPYPRSLGNGWIHLQIDPEPVEARSP